MRAAFEWAAHGERLTVGVEEEVMLLDPAAWSLAQVGDDVLAGLPPELAAQVSAETHAGALELATSPHATVAGAVRELAALRRRLCDELEALGWSAGAAGTHALAQWHETQVSSGARYRLLHGSLRALARREPTFALHVHVGVPDPETAVALAGRLRGHLPMLLALSANSPFWRGADSGLASARTPIFGAFPRVGIPRRFRSYREWVAAVEPLLDSGAIPEPTFLWWDVRLQPRFGTIEVRIMDAQTTVQDVAALVALIQAVAALEEAEPFVPEALLDAPEVLDENRFLAARDGMDAAFVVPGTGRRVPARVLLADLVAAARPHAERLGCRAELDLVEALAADPPAARQRRSGEGSDGLAGAVAASAAAYTAPEPAGLLR